MEGGGGRVFKRGKGKSSYVLKWLMSQVKDAAWERRSRIMREGSGGEELMEKDGKMMRRRVAVRRESW
jgi:hypothetical protein